jgi:putative flippase GtrA
LSKQKEITRGVKFLLFSISAGVIEFVSFALLEAFTPWAYWPKYLIALTLSVLWNFTLNRQFTFRSAGNVPIAMIKVACYYAVFTPLSTILGNYLAETCGWNGILVTILNMAANLVTEYLYDRYFVFGKTIDTNKKAHDSINNTQKESE